MLLRLLQCLRSFLCPRKLLRIQLLRERRQSASTKGTSIWYSELTDHQAHEVFKAGL